MRIIECVAWLIALGSLGCSAAAPDTSEEGGMSVSSTDDALTVKRLCDGPLHLQCPKGQYCSATAAEHCPSRQTFGVCAAQPDRCTDLFAPVCGCDGQTYPNSCFAAASGAAVEHRGACAPSGPMCGGFAGIPCPGMGKCIDDPSDNCDPAHGGADCIGICSCIQNVACKLGTHFNAAPNVCGCTPDAVTQ